MSKELLLGIGTTFNYDIPFEEMIPMIKEASFNAITLGGGKVEHSGYHLSEGRERIKKICAKYDIIVDSIHAPFGKQRDISSLDDSIRLNAIDAVKNAIDACKAIGCKILIIHLNSTLPDDELEDRTKKAKQSLAQLIPYAKDNKVNIAIENLDDADSVSLFEDILSIYKDENFGVCYDSSHANLVPDPFDILKRYPNRIIALHISDNRGTSDDHILPYEGSIDWNEFAKYFLKVKYNGVFMLEVEMRESAFKDPKIFLKEAYERAKKLIGLIEKNV
jgi:L-ribulose-5-phosphate 3-epimerase